MYSEFQAYLLSYAKFTTDELDQVCSRANSKVLERNGFLFQQGEICRHKAFVVTGLLRTYTISIEGNEHILQFNPENTWAIDAESYDNQLPSKYNLAAVEETQLLFWNKPDFDQLLVEIPALKTFAEQLISRAVYNSRERLLTALSASPEEKYTDFLHSYPALMNRLPLRMIAAYLGISIKTLTRIRHAHVKR